MPTNETIDRYEALEELLDIPQPFGFSIPRMHVKEMLTHKGKEYSFFYEGRDNAFLVYEYDAYKKEIASIWVSEHKQPYLMKDEERFNAILTRIQERIIEKNNPLPSVHATEYEQFLAQTQNLTVLTKGIAEEIAVLEKKDAIKETLLSVEEQLTGLRRLIEQQKVEKLKAVLHVIK